MVRYRLWISSATGLAYAKSLEAITALRFHSHDRLSSPHDLYKLYYISNWSPLATTVTWPPRAAAIQNNVHTRLHHDLGGGTVDIFLEP